MMCYLKLWEHCVQIIWKAAKTTNIHSLSSTAGAALKRINQEEVMEIAFDTYLQGIHSENRDYLRNSPSSVAGVTH